MSIPLVNTNNVNDINTSLIAIKKEISSQGNSEVNINVNYNVTEEVTSGVHVPVTSDGVYNAINDTINGLDVSSVGGSGKYIQSISESNGKISATAADIADTVAVDNMNSVTSNAVAAELDKIRGYFSIRVKNVVPTTETTETSYNNRKISDYELILFDVGNSFNNTICTIVLPSDKLVANSTIYMWPVVGGTIYEVDVTIKTDSSFKVQAFNRNNLYLGIYGILRK